MVRGQLLRQRKPHRSKTKQGTASLCLIIASQNSTVVACEACEQAIFFALPHLGACSQASTVHLDYMFIE